MPEPLVFPGIKSDTLLGYLKGLGVLSVLGRQDDPETRASWSPRGFVLHSRQDAAAFYAAIGFVPATDMMVRDRR